MSISTSFRELEATIQRADSYVMYGAGIVAYEISEALRKLYNICPKVFLVSDNANNPKEIQQIPIVTMEQWNGNAAHQTVVVATPEIYHHQICIGLENKGFEEIYCIDSHLEYCVMSRYFQQRGDLHLLEDLPEKECVTGKEMVNTQFSVFMAKSHKDKILRNHYAIPSWIYSVQAGRGCTHHQLEILTDDMGDNISAKNPNYCELTVTYWAWKNKSNTYKGICHYRRMLLLEDHDLEQCIANNVDMILPLPFVCYPNASGQYSRYISDGDLGCLRQALQEVSPEYLSVWENVDKQPYFYNYNMLIAKERIFDDYSKWLFDVLQHAEKYCEPNGIQRCDRYAGYLGELLTTLYIFKHREQFKIVHAEKNWMV